MINVEQTSQLIEILDSMVKIGFGGLIGLWGAKRRSGEDREFELRKLSLARKKETLSKVLELFIEFMEVFGRCRGCSYDYHLCKDNVNVAEDYEKEAIETNDELCFALKSKTTITAYLTTLGADEEREKFRLVFENMDKFRDYLWVGNSEFDKSEADRMSEEIQEAVTESLRAVAAVYESIE